MNKIPVRMFVLTLLLIASATPLSSQAVGPISTQKGKSELSVDGIQNSHLYLESNEKSNKVIHFARRKDGALVEIERVDTEGAGTGQFKPLSGQASAPDTLVSAGAITMSSDHRLLFTVNAGDNSVSSFKVESDGRLKLADRQATGETGTASSLSYNDRTGTLYVLHSFGPNHIRSFQVKDGKLANTGARYTANSGKWARRIPTQVLTSPDGRFVLVNVLYNDFSPPGVLPKAAIAANDGTKDGLLVFPVNGDGSLGEAVVNDAGGAEPFGLAFLNGSSDTFVNTFAKGDGVTLSKLLPDGQVTHSPLASANVGGVTGPSETCWVSLSPDNKFAYATNFARGDLTSFSIDNGTIKGARGNLGKVAGDGSFIKDGIASSAPIDSWGSPDGYLYQLYPNASKLVAFRMNGADLEPLGEYPIPYNGTMGITGY